MGRHLSSPAPVELAGVISPSSDMPISGKFGAGKVVFITKTGTFKIPAKDIRVRVWGGGAGNSGGGGGFAIKTISGLTIGESVAVTVPDESPGQGGTASFGAHVSATGGLSADHGLGGIGGVGIGGDINNEGGMATPGTGAGAGAGNLIGKGGDAGKSGTSGGGAVLSSGIPMPAGTGFAPPEFSIDFIGCGSGLVSQPGMYASVSYPTPPQNPNAGNGGGAPAGMTGSFPAGGGGLGHKGGKGLIVVEY